MRTRKTDVNKRRDPWYRKLSRDERDVYEWLLDQADDAGFVEMESELLCFECKLDPKVVEGCLETLTKPYQGSHKVLVRDYKGDDGGIGEALIWIPNYIKIQQNGKFYNPRDNWHVKILELLMNKGDSFPEVQPLTRVSPHPPKGIHREEEKRIDKKREGGSGGKQDSQTSKMTNSQLKGRHPLYDKILDCEGLRAGFPYETFVTLRKDYPDAAYDWDEVVKWTIGVQIGSSEGVKNAFLLLTSAFKNGKFQRKGAPPVTGSQAAFEKEKASINRAYENEEIDDIECGRRMAIAKERHGVD